MPKILVVDDNAIERKGILMLSRRMFQGEAGASIIYLEAENGSDALELAQRERPDVILTDIRMPRMDGLTLLSRVSKFLPETVTIIISAYGEFDYAQSAIECGVSHYLLKPIDPDRFRKVMEKALAAVTVQTASLKHKKDSPKEALTSMNLELRSRSTERVIGEVISIVHNEYMTDLSLEDIATRISLTPSYLSYVFKKSTGHTLVKYLVDYRLERARELLTMENRKIADVAVSVGYRDVSYFCTQFKNKFGMTPSQFRNQPEED